MPTPEHIWVTRTEPGAGLLCSTLQRQGHKVWCAPVLEIEWLRPWRCIHTLQARICDAAQARQVAATAPDIVFVMSAHAAREYLACGLAAAHQQLVHIAVGEQSAAVLRTSLPGVMMPALATSEGLLQMPEVSGLAENACAWIVAGADGRDVLAQGLQQQGLQQVYKFELYRRQPLPVANIPVDQIAVIIIGSIAGLENAVQLWLNAGGSRQVKLLVPSARVAEKAAELGFAHVYNSHGASAETISQALDRMGSRDQNG